jgi:hypothetical protein
MKFLTIFLLIFSFNAFSKCGLLIEDGGWSDEGKAGIVEVDFDQDNTASIHFIGGTQENLIVTDTRASWDCSHSKVSLKIDGTSIVGRIEKLGDTGMWSIRFEESAIEILGGRLLTPFRY